MAQFRGTRSDTVVVGVAELRVGASRLRSVFDWPLFFEGTAWQSSAIVGSLDESSRIVKPDLLNEVKVPSHEGVGSFPLSPSTAAEKKKRRPPEENRRLIWIACESD